MILVLSAVMPFVLLLIVGKWFLLMFICLFDDANELSDEIMSSPRVGPGSVVE